MEPEDPKLLEFPGEEKLHYKDLTREIIGTAIEVHRTLAQVSWNPCTKNVFAMKWD